MGTISKYIDQFERGDFPVDRILLARGLYTDFSLTKIIDCLLQNPNAVTLIALNVNRLTDESGVKLARFIAGSSTISYIDISNNRFSAKTYLAIAAALCVNTSLKKLYLFNNEYDNAILIDTSFANAIRLNPIRSPKSMWWLYMVRQYFTISTKRAKRAAPPSMLEFLLYVHLDFEKNKTKIH